MTATQFIQMLSALGAIVMIQIGSSWIKQYVRSVIR